ncbi:hypothetical protein [Hoylesella timonensis]|nr:hypothetical protein [Hoylesella timonensis]
MCSRNGYEQRRGEAPKENNLTQCAAAMISGKDGAKPQKEYSPW